MQINLATYTAGKNAIFLVPNDEIKIWVVRPDGFEDVLTLEATGLTTARYTTYYTPTETGGYDFKIQLSKPGYEEVVYGEDPYPVIHMSATSAGDVGGGGITQYVWVAIPILVAGFIFLLLRGGK